MNHEVPHPAQWGYKPTVEESSNFIQNSPYSYTKIKWKCTDNPFYWDYWFVNFYNKKGTILTSFFHNAPSFVEPLYVMQNDEFIITSRHYQCLSVYNITKNEWKDYTYKTESDFIEGRGFCPLELDYMDKILRIVGCVTDGPYEIMYIHNIDLNNIIFDQITWEDYYEGENR